MKRTLLIDGDIIAFTIASRCTQSIDWDGDGSPTQHVDEDQALTQSVCWLSHLKRQTKADSAIICLSDPSRRYFRHSVYPMYKHDRTQGQPPAILPTIKALLRNGIKGFESKWVSSLEADDVLGILATNPIVTDTEFIIATRDKDLRQIPCTYHDVHTEKSEKITKAQGDYFFYMQMLTGDPTDGYPGCYRIGPKKAEKIILEALALDPTGGAVWPAVLATYERAGADEEYALSQARCARILQWTDYNFRTKEPILWTPSPASA